MAIDGDCQWGENGIQQDFRCAHFLTSLFLARIHLDSLVSRKYALMKHTRGAGTFLCTLEDADKF